jgi:carbon-monoxide dehydrogenase small subunit
MPYRSRAQSMGPSVIELELSVNGMPVSTQVDPRQNLADFIRERLGLKGTHLGCEHGACGACTVLMDGVPIRSCITLAGCCQQAEIVTIEGYGEDAVMQSLREAFHEEHALQCGYCTPGMLATARDIVLRHEVPDTEAIRAELAGCLCRCTGYRGIVNAIARVIEARGRAGAQHGKD